MLLNESACDIFNLSVFLNVGNVSFNNITYNRRKFLPFTPLCANNFLDLILKILIP